MRPNDPRGEAAPKTRRVYSTAQEVASHLQRRRPEIIRDWEQRVLADPEVPEARGLTRPALRDHIPQVLDALIAELSSSSPTPSDGGRLANLATEEHAHERFEQRYTLESAIREWSLFRSAIIKAWYDGGLYPHPSLVMRMHAAIDNGIRLAATTIHTAAQAELAESEEKLREQMAFQDRFMAILGHDLRTPLNAVSMGVTFLLKHADLPEGHASLLRRAASSAARMARMINDVLDLARTRIGQKFPIEPVDATDLGTVCESVVDEFRAAKPERGIEVETTGTLVGNWDPDRLHQAIANLIGNAIDYSPPESIVKVCLAEDAGSAVISVTNQGPPIPAELLEHIFDPYRRQQQNGAMTSRGLGLGMFIVKGIIDAHGGSVDIRSSDVEGTRVELRLPKP
ncbi:MAG: sensor histidine kinase [Polyangiaceae bacterium]|nr:sensor histidine kinase [Polyangiaceae bacterium]